MQKIVPEPEIGDAFGEMLRRCHAAGRRPGAAFEVIERSDGLISVGDAARYFADVDAWPEYEQHVLTELSGTVLDVGCGAGRHAAVLTAAGWDVLGVDQSSGAVDVACDRGAKAVVGTATALPHGIGRFSSILLLGTILVS